MSGRAGEYGPIGSGLLLESDGARLDLAFAQLFFNALTVAVAQTAAMSIEASGYVAQTGAVKLESSGSGVLQPLALPLEARLAVTQTVAEPLEAGAPSVSQTAEENLESFGHLAQTQRANVEAFGAATAKQTAIMNIEKIMIAGSYVPTPRTYYESIQAPAYTAELNIESEGITVTQTQRVNLEAGLDPDAFAVMHIESLPHVVDPITGVMPIAALKWLTKRATIPFDFMHFVGSASVGVLPVEARGLITATLALRIESQAEVQRTAAVPVELPRIAAHNAAGMNVELFERLVVQAIVHLESPPESIAVNVPASADGFLTVIKGGEGTLTIHEALPLSESLTD